MCICMCACISVCVCGSLQKMLQSIYKYMCVFNIIIVCVNVSIQIWVQ